MGKYACELKVISNHIMLSKFCEVSEFVSREKNDQDLPVNKCSTNRSAMCLFS